MAPDMAVRIPVQTSPDYIDCEVHQHSLKGTIEVTVHTDFGSAKFCILMQHEICIMLWIYRIIEPRPWRVNRVDLLAFSLYRYTLC
jgi:hypothetical protein